MSTRVVQASKLSCYPLTPERWDDLEKLFGEKGEAGGCWCMWWRTTRAQFERNRSEGNKRAFKGLVDSGEVPGIIAYREHQPVGWCSIAPRPQYGALERSPVLRRLDREPVWSIVCFFIPLKERRQGVASSLLEAAVDFARKKGAKIIESYPINNHGHEQDPGSIFMGVSALFEKMGFRTVAHPTDRRLIMRKLL